MNYLSAVTIRERQAQVKGFVSFVDWREKLCENEHPPKVKLSI